MDDELMAHLQALTIAVVALLATHPEPEKLRPAFERMAQSGHHPHPTYEATIGTLRKAISSR
jgi:hypothetical protein